MKGTKGAATNDAMGELHDALAKYLTDVIKNGETVEKRGEKKKVPASAAMLNVARGFLKDNSIECDPDYKSRPVGKLTEALAEYNKRQEEEEDLPKFVN